MKKYSTLLFDLDGTIIDSYPGIANCFQHALNLLGHTEEILDFTPFIGPPLRSSFLKVLQDEEKAEQGLNLYRERYKEIGIYECTLYDGIPQMLKAAKEAGYTILLATSKLRIYAQEILRHYHLDQYFDYIGGALPDGSISEKADVMLDAMAHLHIDPSTVLMIGDRLYDMVGAKACGVDAVGVLFGFGDEEELSAYSPVYLAPTAYDLKDFLLSVKG